MARPGRPERNRAARSFRQLRRFHHVINWDKVFGTHSLPAGRTAARNLTTGSYSEFWRGAGIDRAKLVQALPDLPDTAVELNAVAKSVGAPASDIHLGADASETVVKRTALFDYRVLYFATHALVAGDVVGLAEPSLVLSIPIKPSDYDDGLLTASEVAQLKLNADWVVVSACNTIAGTSLEPKLCRVLLDHSFTAAPGRCWFRTGRSTPPPPLG
jgi:CHAT domain-containing protein